MYIKSILFMCFHLFYFMFFHDIMIKIGDDSMKCEKCGFIPNPGDQVCINCGAKLSVKNAVMQGLETVEVEKENKKSNKNIIFLIIGIVFILIIIFLLLWRFL